MLQCARHGISTTTQQHPGSKGAAAVPMGLPEPCCCSISFLSSPGCWCMYAHRVACCQQGSCCFFSVHMQVERHGTRVLGLLGLVSFASFWCVLHNVCMDSSGLCRFFCTGMLCTIFPSRCRSDDALFGSVLGLLCAMFCPHCQCCVQHTPQARRVLPLLQEHRVLHTLQERCSFSLSSV